MQSFCQAEHGYSRGFPLFILTITTYSFSLYPAFPGENKINQLLNIAEIIVVPGNSLTVVNNSVLLVAFQTVHKLFRAVFADELLESVWLYLSEQPFPAILPALPAAGYPFLSGAFTVLAPCAAGAFV